MPKMNKKQALKKIENGEYWQEKANQHLLNKTIKEVRWVQWDNDEENTGLVMLLNNGALLWLQQDDEGNGPGALYIQWHTEPGDVRATTSSAGLATATLPVGVVSYEEVEELKNEYVNEKS